MKALLVQPPFTQLNAPYPAVHYLEAFLRSRGIEARSVDHSIELYRAIFSRRGLATVFAEARAALGRACEADVQDTATISELERYLSYEDLYLEWIDGLVAFLSGGDPALAHRLSQAVELPRGMRSQAYLASRGGRIAQHEARALATAILEDLGDLVSYALDPSFSTVRYGERIAASASSFATIRSALDSSPLLEAAYAPLLAAEWEKEGRAPELFLVTLPFPGCLLGALACARSARAAFGDRTRIVFGGGYVSTELRSLRDNGIFDFCDYLSFDAGYGSLASILEVDEGAPRERLYKTMYRGDNGRVVAAGFEEGDAANEEHERRRVTRCDHYDAAREAEDRATASVAPDYEGVDFGRYLQVVDSENPMHRLWSDSPWLKYRLAQGCYWRRCAFCDTELEYVSRFTLAEAEALLAAADAASSRTGLYGLHFVDEAMPMGALLSFARANRVRGHAGQRPFHYWGNVRFDSSWTEDRCEYLAASGLVAVSGGIEIATEGGLEITDKGFDLAGLVRTLVAMRRAGLLVHAYLIYGFPGQSRAEIVDSAEVCRQLFAAGLIDSAFWHRFVLTRHSRMYAEWRTGKRQELRPIDRAWDFANNDLGFAGEEANDEFDGPLAATLEAWMSGEGLERGAALALEEAGLRGARRGASAARDLVESLIAKAEAQLDAARTGREGAARWIAGLPLVRPADAKTSRLAWTYRGEARELLLPRDAADQAAAALASLARDSGGTSFAALAASLVDGLGLNAEALGTLRSSGLVVI
jgi:radical SAM superfamily enzyme YgiQ (UPF0313 family)